MIVITPYLVKPVSDSAIRLPTDGINSIDDAQRVIMGKVLDKSKDTSRPLPTIAPAAPGGPEMGSVSDAAPALPKNGREGNGASLAVRPRF